MNTYMGTWGIAIDMAKKNKENISLLRSKSAFDTQMILDWAYSKKRVYKFKSATPEILAEIRIKLAKKRRSEIIRSVVAILTSIAIVSAFFILI